MTDVAFSVVFSFLAVFSFPVVFHVITRFAAFSGPVARRFQRP